MTVIRAEPCDLARRRECELAQNGVRNSCEKQVFGDAVQIDVDGVEVHCRVFGICKAPLETQENRGLPGPDWTDQEDAVVVDRTQDAPDQLLPFIRNQTVGR